MKAASDARLAELVQALSPDGGGEVLLLPAGDASAIAAAATHRDGHDVVAVHGSPRSLRHGAASLEAQGLTHRLTLVRTTRGLVRLTAGSTTGVSEQLGLGGSARWAADHLPPKLTTSALAHRSSAVALFTRPGARPPLAWLAAKSCEGSVAAVLGHHGHTVSIRTSAGAAAGGLFAKWASAPEGVERLQREESALERYATSAREGGFDVPAPRAVDLPDGAYALAFEAREGGTAATLLRSGPSLLPRLVDTIVSTVEAWNLRASVRKPFGATAAARRLEEDLETLGGRLETGAIRSAVEAAAGVETPVGPAHGDVTMANVLLGGAGVTLVDWEDAVDEALPGFDAEYALVDAAAAAGGYRDRVGAARAAGVESWRERLAATLGVPEPVARLAPITCWAHHAANELRKGGGDPSFLTLLRRSVTEAGR